MHLCSKIIKNDFDNDFKIMPFIKVPAGQTI